MIDIKERARRVTTSIEEARAAAVRLGDRNGPAIGEDAYELARHVLAQDDGGAARLELTVRISALRAALASIQQGASDALQGTPKAPGRCLCQLPGPGRSMQCGGIGEYDPACDCECHLPTARALPAEEQGAVEHWIERRCPQRDDELKASGDELPVDPAHPAQTVVPGTVEERAPVVVHKLGDFEPPAETIVAYAARGVDFAAFILHVRAFRAAYIGEKSSDWDGLFRSWLDARLSSAASPVEPTPPTPPAPAGPKARAPEVETPVESWEPPMGLLLELSAAHGRERVELLLGEFRKVNAGRSAKRWAPTLRTWMAAQKA